MNNVDKLMLNVPAITLRILTEEYSSKIILTTQQIRNCELMASLVIARAIESSKEN